MKKMKYPSKIRIVTVGGGTGSSVMLRGLKKYTPNITAIVTVADDGGGSGFLREDLGMLPPGDIRACLIALSNSETEMTKLMNYRFNDCSGRLANQSFGNIFLAALNDIYGDFEVGLKEASKVLAITGKVLPMSLEDVILYAELEDGSVIQGESNITFLTRKSGGRIKRVYVEPELIHSLDEAIDEIMNAKVILLGPGSLYTSIMPNLLVKDIREALSKSSAKIVYVCNVMTQAGETEGYGAFDHMEAIIKHCDECFIDYIFVNDKEIPAELKLRYQFMENTNPVVCSDEDIEKISAYDVQVIKGDFSAISGDFIIHDADKISNKILELFED